jgi:hypothetical protein
MAISFLGYFEIPGGVKKRTAEKTFPPSRRRKTAPKDAPYGDPPRNPKLKKGYGLRFFNCLVHRVFADPH